MKQHFKKLALAASTTAMALAAGASQAAIDIAADTTAAKSDIATAGGLIVGVVVAVAAISWVRRVIR